MILTTLIDGKARPGVTRKAVVHPSTGASSDSIAYAHSLTILPFSGVADTQKFQRELIGIAAKFARYLKENEEPIAQNAAKETGSPIRYQRHDIEGSRTFLRRLRTLNTILPAKYQYEPKGNILLILSGNEPIITSTILVFSCLFMGNVVYVKPSSKSPSYSRMLVRQLTKTPLLKKRVHYLLADGAETERLIRAQSFDFVLAFGSRSTNKRVGIICAEEEVEFLPESEGNDWAYVDKISAPVAEISRTIVDSFTRHNGQMCNALRGVMIHAGVYEKLLLRLKHDFSRLTLGSPLRSDTQIGALIAGTESHAERLVEEAGTHAKEMWRTPAADHAFRPAIIIEPKNISSVFSESVFAPILWIKKVKSHEEAISFFREKNRHGLGFSVFSKNKKVVDEYKRNIRVGRININAKPLDIGLFDPLGGIRLSGHGGPSHWIEKVTNRKFINW